MAHYDDRHGTASMLEPYTTIMGVSLNTVTYYAGIGVLLAFGVGVVLLRQHYRLAQVIDSGLVILVLALVGARAGQVLLDFDYFRDHVDQALWLNEGGLNWHGAFVGGLMGSWIASRVFKVHIAPLMDALAVVLPLVAALTWYGCSGWGCGYGREVTTMADYPAVLVVESRDIFGLTAPRMNTHGIGMLLSLTLAVIALGLTGLNWLYGRRLWLIVSLFSCCMLVLGLWRGDFAPLFWNLRIDQWWDAGLLILSITVLFIMSSKQQLNVSGRED